MEVIAADGTTKVNCCLENGDLVAEIKKGFFLLVH